MNPWHNARLLNATANAMLGLVALGVVAAGIWWFIQRPMFALRAISVDAVPGETLRHVNVPLLRAAGVRRVPGNFFTVDLAGVRAAFERAPWVRRATVRRVWPNRLAVSIEEHRPFAGWSDGRFVNMQGELFAVNQAEAEEDGPLPQLAGPDGSAAEVLAKFRELTGDLAPLSMQPVSLALTARWAWSAQLDNGMTLLMGREQGQPVRERVRRFVAAYPELAARVGRAPATVDLRYPNGFAIRLADAPAEEKKQR